jgi:hypothetical protein
VRNPEEFLGRPDRRGEKRHKANFIVWADVGDGRPLIKCQVLNVSESGAHITPVCGEVVLPDEFAMKVEKSGAVWDARVVWRSGHGVGAKIAKRSSS